MWQPTAAVVRQQQADSGYAIVRRAVAVREQDVADARRVAAAHGVSIFNPNRGRYQARLPHDADLRQRVVAALRRRGWLAGGQAPAAAAILHSASGCQAQGYHFDFEANAVVRVADADKKPFSVLLALEDDTTLDLLPGGAPLVLQRGDLLRWNGDVAHRGSAYLDKDNTRFFMYVNASGIAAPADGTYPYDQVQAAALLAQAETAARRQDAATLLTTLRAPPPRVGQDAATRVTTLRAPPPVGQDAATLLATLRAPRCGGIGPWLQGQRCTHPVDPGTAALARPLCARCRAQRAAAARRRRAAAAAAPGRKSRNRAAARDTCVGCGGAIAWPAHLQQPRTSRCHPCFAAQRRTTRTTRTTRPAAAAAARARCAARVLRRRVERVFRCPQITAAARDAKVRALIMAAAVRLKAADDAAHAARGGATTRGTGRGAPRTAPPPPLLDNTNTGGRVARIHAA